MDILNVCKICAFICMVCCYGLSNTVGVHDTKESNFHDLVRMKRWSATGRGKDREIQNDVNDLNHDLDESMNIVKREAEIQQEVDILKHWQDMSATSNKRHRRENVGNFVKTNRRRRAPKGFWWGCPICDGTTKLVPSRPGCKCDIKPEDRPLIL